MVEEKSSKPREMVHRAQAECARALHQLRRARKDMPDSVDEARAAAEFHDAVMLFWEQIKRFRDREHIEERWHERPAYDDVTLDDLADLRLTTEQRERTYRDPDTGLESSTTEEVAWQLKPRQAVQVYDALDICANKLGFDAEPVQIRKKFGYETVDMDEVESSEFAPNAVEVPE